MTVLTQIIRIVILLLNLHLPSKEIIQGIEITGIQREFEKKKRKQKEALRHPPPWQKKPRFKKEKIPRHLRSTAPKDVRFSNQMKLRRMYRNS